MSKILTEQEELHRNLKFFAASEAFISVVDSIMKKLINLPVTVDERNQILFSSMLEALRSNKTSWVSI